MKLKALGLIVASVVLTAVFYACASKTEITPVRDVETLIPATGSSPNGCAWQYNTVPAQKNKVKDPIALSKNPGGVCSVDSPSNTLYIGNAPGQAMKVGDIGGIEFILEGSCKYCYTNTSGGMSCVTYPGPPCK
jgi:hypothetical protein